MAIGNAWKQVITSKYEEKKSHVLFVILVFKTRQGSPVDNIPSTN